MKGAGWWSISRALRAGALVLALGLAACGSLAPNPSPSPSPQDSAPEADSGWQAKSGTLFREQVAVAAHPLAARAGADILRQGGSAADAAIAMQMVLTLVEPQSSGIGGGAFLLHHDGRELQAWDGRERAPAAAGPDLFLRPDGKPMPFGDAVVGGRSVGVPGVVAMLAQLHRQHGQLPWKELFQPAIQLARQGFAISPRLARLLTLERRLTEDPDARAYFFDPQGKPWPAGHLLKNPALADTLQLIAEQGPDAFYRGPLAAAMARKVAGHQGNPGLMNELDLANYQVKLREAVCGDYRSWRVCGMPPPSSGGIAVLQMLGILHRWQIQQLAPKDGALQPRAVHLFSEAGRLVYADRMRYVADTDFVALPGNSPKALLDPDYLAKRATLVGERSMQHAAPGQPLGVKFAQGDDHSLEAPSTSHLVARDKQGRVVSMTSSIERAFGSQLMVGGFMLNNELTDFSFLPSDANGPVANRVQPGKRPRSAMSPTMVFERSSGKLVLALGSPGGPAIINYVAKSLIGTLSWGMSLQDAVELPNFGSRNGPTDLEAGRFDPRLIADLRERRHVVVQGPQTSGLHGLQWLENEQRWLGAVDPRREGAAFGD